ncbi:hypothetical protein FQA39_LY09302 [Lamprigera yunnana]|nr:hypothetical protein FQA39_LY09302 [Lamprigera yunnana]
MQYELYENKDNSHVERNKMIEQALESMVTHLVQCTSNGTISCSKSCSNEVVEHEDLVLQQPISAICSSDAQNTTYLSWNSIIKGLLSQYSSLSNYGMELNSLGLNLQHTHNRKVLAPLALKQNTDNIIAGNLDMRRKRKSDTDTTCWAPPNKIPKLDLSPDNLKSCSVILKRTSVRNLLLQYKCISKVPFVKLFDVLKEIPQEKEIEKVVEQPEFMSFFGLENRGPISSKHVHEIKTSHPIKLTKTVSIPFSSIYGQRLLLRERHSMSQEAALKKIERTDWYLKEKETRNTPQDYSPLISYEKKPKYTRTYKFPKTQFRQKVTPIKRQFLEYLCKPVCVELERIDISSILARKKEEEEAKMSALVQVFTSVTEHLTNIIEVSSTEEEDEDDDPLMNCQVILSESDTMSVQNLDLGLVALSDNYSNCIDVSEWSSDSSDIIFVGTTMKEKGPRRSSRLTYSNLL